MANGTNQKLSPAQKAAIFNKLTRRNWQSITEKTGAESGQITFSLPKARLLAGCELYIEATLTATHASSTSYAPHEDSPFKFLSRVEMFYNQGFSPFAISGQALADYNKTIHGVVAMTPATSGRGRVVQGLTASSSGTANTVRFQLTLPNMLNESSPVGMIVLQNDETLVDINVSLGTKADLAPAASGYTFAVSNIVVGITTDTFTIPADPNARPDISVLKLVHEKVEPVVEGENIIALSTSRTYRKLGFILYSATPSRQNDSIITSPIELVANQADIPYRIKPKVLAAMNASKYGGALLDGSYVFDFSDNGIPNFGGNRDYFDTERLTEFNLKFTSSAAGTVRIWSETLARLAAE
jgi:hypothetical protein